MPIGSRSIRSTTFDDCYNDETSLPHKHCPPTVHEDYPAACHRFVWLHSPAQHRGLTAQSSPTLDRRDDTDSPNHPIKVAVLFQLNLLSLTEVEGISHFVPSGDEYHPAVLAHRTDQLILHAGHTRKVNHCVECPSATPFSQPSPETSRTVSAAPISLASARRLGLMSQSVGRAPITAAICAATWPIMPAPTI